MAIAKTHNTATVSNRFDFNWTKWPQLAATDK
jgi:hypothetical protein